MIGRIDHGRRVLAYFLVEQVFGAAAFFSAYLLRHQLAPWFPESLNPLTQYLWLLPVFLVLWSLYSWSGDAYSSFRSRTPITHAFRLLVSEGLTLFSVFAILALVKATDVNRSLVMLVGITHFALLFILRIAARALLGYATSKGYDRHFVLIVGTDADSVKLAKALEEYPGGVFQVKGLISDNPEDAGRQIDTWKVLGTVEQIPEIGRREVIDEVFLIPKSMDLQSCHKTIRECDAMGIVVHLNLPLFEEISSRVGSTRIQDRSFLTLSSVPPSATQLLFKRAIDIVASMILLGLLSPLLILTGLLVLLTSAGGAVFRQQRVGMNGRKFVLYKFRTMKSGAEKERAALESQNELDGPAFKMKDDPRITWCGGFLRRTSLDELPQLLNVLKGDMSLVGPRPLPDYEVEKFQPWHRRRMNMRPGITCLWQISGRNEVQFDDWMKLDLEYIDRWNLWLDFSILFRTVPAVLRGRGAY